MLMVYKIFFLMFVLSFLAFSCSSKKEIQSSTYIKSKNYLKQYINDESKNLSVSKKEKEVFDPVSGNKVKKVSVNVDVDSLERHLKKTLDKREVKTFMVPSPPIPIMIPARVVRVLVYPYIDSEGNFHGPNYLYMEIEKSRWVVGDYNSPSGVSSKSFTILEK